MPATLEPVSPEFMLDTLDHGKLYLHGAHRTAIDLLLKQAGKADADNEIAECRRCCVAILNFEIKYPPKHAFVLSPLPLGEGPGVRDADDDEGDEEDDAPATTVAPASPPLPLPAGEGEGRGEGVIPSAVDPSATPTQNPAPVSPSLREGAGGRVGLPPETITTPVPPESTPPSVPSVPSPSSASESAPPPEPYNPVGELWPPGLDPVTWRDKRPRREPSKPFKPYKPYIHRNYLYILLMGLSALASALIPAPATLAPMKTSLDWLNSYLAPRVTSAEEAEQLLTFAGFPLESITALDGVNAGDYLLDVEVTSNRGDCLSHIGLAREIAAASVRMLSMPVAAPEAKGPETGELVALGNQVHETCPRFTLRVIRGVKIGPSPAWMQKALTAIGLRPINNVVDVTNFVQHELGSPSHVFDLAKLAKAPDGKPAVIIRKANAGEKLTLLDGKTIELKPSDVVVADAREAVSLAGIMGGGPSGVSDSTTDVLVEVATWDPATIRATARRLNLRTDASHRFERVVDPRTIAAASNRICELILQVAGGELSKTLLAAGPEMKPLEAVMLRHARVNQVLGASFTDAQITTALEAQGFKDAAQPVSPTHHTNDADSKGYRVTVPAHRPDVRLEIDLIEEVGRTIGYDKLAIPEKLPVRVSAVQTTELASRELARVLTGAGFYETVTFSFINKKQAAPFLPPGMNLLAVSEDRRGEDNIVRPGIIPSLMLCRRANQAARVSVDGGVRLYEFASVYAEMTPAKKGEQGTTVEHRNLGLLADVVAGPGMKAAEARQHAVRLMRGVIDQLVRATVGVGVGAKLTVEPGKVPFTALDPAASAGLMLDGKPFGWFGVIGASTQALFDLEMPVVVAEMNVPVLLEAFPPRSDVHLLPTFPAVERDLSLIVDEQTPWAKVDAALTSAAVEQLESWRFVGVYRGQPLAAGKKSVTFRMVFRDEAKTLRDDEVNARVETLVGRLKKDIPLEIRTA